ncbi:MAG: peptidase [Formosa sp.]|jgi:hypothetical protein|nr:peptidase [Formosa sp.]MDC3198714.1 M14 family metallocarboxypeptidase [Flavobacteriaceae bacterium]|tara:strand:- start:905 stop:2440 length:1536 start_codon:yes stop_codon:yes gene_type:complete
MRNSIILVISVFVFFALQAQPSPQSKKITKKFFPDSESLLPVTPALKKKRGYTNYKELISFINDLKESHPSVVSIKYIGESQKGYKIPVIQIKTISDSEKIKIWMQAGLHGNEPAGTEGLLYYMHSILNNNSYADLLEGVDLLILPMANIDGYLKDNRYAANGLDLNRDQTKLMAPETRLIKKVFCEFNAHVGLDFHEYRPYRKDFAQLSDFGITSAYDTMFLYSGNLNVPENIRNYTNDVFVQNARKLMDFKNFRHREYTSTGKYAGEIHFTQGSSNARSSATNYALNNMISTLFEVRGVGLGKTSFKRRIEITLELALSYTKTAVENTTAIKNEIQKAILDSKPVVVTSKRKVYKDTIKAIDLDTESLIDLDVTIRDALQSSPVLERLKPNAYIIEASQIAILNKLKNLGIEMIPLIEDKLFTVEAYRISSYNEASKVYEKMKLQKVKTEVTTIQKEFPVGTLLISMQQQRSNLLTEVLEPEAPNSFVSFGVLKTKLDDTLPIYRVINK